MTHLSPHNLLGIVHIVVQAQNPGRECFVVRLEDCSLGIGFGHAFKLFDDDYNSKLIIDVFVPFYPAWYFTQKDKYETE
jgi:hypothetical protein